MKKKPAKKPAAPAAQQSPAPGVIMVTAEKLAQISNLTARRINQLAESGKIPPGTGGQFPLLATITALFAFYQRDGEEIQKEKLLKLTAERKMKEDELAKIREQTKPTTSAGTRLPALCASMAQAEGIYHVPRKMLEHAKENGCAEGFDGAGRVRIIGVLKFFRPMLAKIFEGQVPEFKDFQVLDLQAELANKAKEDARAKKRENDLAEGLIHNQADIEELLWEYTLKPLRDEYLAFDRKYVQVAKAGGAIDPAALSRDFSAIMKRVRDALPARKLEEGEK